MEDKPVEDGSRTFVVDAGEAVEADEVSRGIGRSHTDTEVGTCRIIAWSRCASRSASRKSKIAGRG